MKLSSAAQAVSVPSSKSRWIPAIFVLGFLIVIAVNTVLIVTAVRTFSGLETSQAYEQGLAYNTILAAAAKNEKDGWHAVVTISPLDPTGRRLSVQLVDGTQQALPNLTVEAILVRPTNAGLDEAIQMHSIGNGIYQADFRPSALGNWDLRLLAKSGKISWQHSERIFLK